MSRSDLREKLKALADELEARSRKWYGIAEDVLETVEDPDAPEESAHAEGMADAYGSATTMLRNLLASHEEGETASPGLTVGVHADRGDNSGWARVHVWFPGIPYAFVTDRLPPGDCDQIYRRLRSHTDREPDGWVCNLLPNTIATGAFAARLKANENVEVRPVYIGPPVQPEEES